MRRAAATVLTLVVAVALSTCSPPRLHDGALIATLSVDEQIRSSCLEVVAETAEGNKVSSDRFERRESHRVVILGGGPLSGELLVLARGYLGQRCEEPLRFNDESPQFFARLVPGAETTLDMRIFPLSPAVDVDRDGYRAASAGGPDCDDFAPGVGPGQPEVCSDGVDTDCNGLRDCEEPSCGAPGCGGPDGGSDGGTDGGTDAGPVFTYAPSNFDAGGFNPSGELLIDCGNSAFDSTSLDASWCGRAGPAPVVIAQGAGGPDAVVLPMSKLRVEANGVLRVTGQRPVIFAVYGDATVAGWIQAGADGTLPGPGGSRGDCGARAGANAGTELGLSGGGGGGAFGTAGGRGGSAATNPGTAVDGGAGGVAGGNAELRPLLGGCGGGLGGQPDGGAPGAGGGGVQISSAGALTVTGRISAPGGGGRGGIGLATGGGGAGSGGGVLLEGVAVVVEMGAWITANGGGGGQGAAPGTDGDDGENGAVDSNSPARGGRRGGTNGGRGGNGATGTDSATDGAEGGGGPLVNAGGGGGAGAGVGRVRVNAARSCRILGGAANMFSPLPTIGGAADAGC